MGQKEYIKLFEEKKVRSVWDDEKEEWFFSIVDVCGVLTDQPDYDHAKNYWKVLKFRLHKEGGELVANCNQLKMVSPKDGKKRLTDVATVEHSSASSNLSHRQRQSHSSNGWHRLRHIVLSRCRMMRE